MGGTASNSEQKLGAFKRTKIIATLGPSVDSYESVEKLIKAGADALRLNFSHGTHKERTRQITWARTAAKKTGKTIAIIQDLQGPKLRLGDFDDVINIARGKVVSFKFDADYVVEGHIPLQHDISPIVSRGQRLLCNDGRLELIVKAVRDGVIYAEASTDGILLRRKGLNLPDSDFKGQIITDKDKQDLAFGTTSDVDWVALSFVQTASDIRSLRKLMHNLGSRAKIIAKIETKAAVDNIEEIARDADGLMIARGDLAVETLPESVPMTQRSILALGRRLGKPTIVATQLLSTMTDTPQPTRAEVSDIATAVMAQADCVMLSDETASGRYPIEAVKVMKRVIIYTEAHNDSEQGNTKTEPSSRQEAICAAVMSLAEAVHARAIVAETKSGATAIQISASRPHLPVIAVTSDPCVANQIAIFYGVRSYVRPDSRYAAVKLTNWLKATKILKTGDVVVTCSGQYPGVVGATDTIKVRLLE